MRVLAIAVLCGLAACSTNPREKAADAAEEAADGRADMMEAEIANQVAPMEAQANQLRAEAKTKPGYEGRILETRARALDEEANIKKDQARARAAAIRAQGDAEASRLRAQ